MGRGEIEKDWGKAQEDWGRKEERRDKEVEGRRQEKIRRRKVKEMGRTDASKVRCPPLHCGNGSVWLTIEVLQEEFWEIFSARTRSWWSGQIFGEEWLRRKEEENDRGVIRER